MAKALMVVLTRCNDPKRIDEFNEWYSFHHQADVAEVDHFLNASRYRLIGKLEGTGSQEPEPFLAVYELDTDDVPTLQKAVLETMGAKAEKGRIVQHETCDVISVGFYAFHSEVRHSPGG